jgi:hypothetical protein
MQRISLPLGAIMLAVGLALSACSAGTPSKHDLSESLSERLLDSDLSDDQLNAIADNNRAGLSGDEQDEALDDISSALTECNKP